MIMIALHSSQFLNSHFPFKVVAGSNYFVKIHVGDEVYVHARIYVHFSGDTSLHSIQRDKTHGDAVEYFE